MFSTLTQKLLLGLYIFILLSIPIGAYLVSQDQTIKGSAQEPKTVKKLALVTPKPATSPAKELLSSSEAKSVLEPTATPSPSSSLPTVATSFGPTLSLKVTLEGRPAGNQVTKLFVGIAEGTVTTNPKFLLSFSVDLPASGEYGNLSLAGLNPGSNYTALLKGSAQIAAAITFTMSPTATNLNDGQPINLLSGDLNEDNVINSADYSIVQKTIGATPRSSNWDENGDLNKDGLINIFDLAIITNNIGKTGDTGAWTSPLPKVATPSASLNTPAVGGPDTTAGYWLWLPK